MKVFWKYLLWLLSFLIITILYLLKTSSGNHLIEEILGSLLSIKTHNDLKVSSLNINNYPTVSMYLEINGGARVFMKGVVDSNEINMNYHLVGNSFRYNSIDLKDNINVEGNISGNLSEPSIKGEGEVFDGKIDFSFIKSSKAFKKLKIKLRNASSRKLLIYLKKRPLLNGKADIDIEFNYFSKYKRTGKALVLVKKAIAPLVLGSESFLFKSRINFEDRDYFYNIGVSSKNIGNISIFNGYYNKDKHEGRAKYTLDINDLSYFKKFLKHKYRGSFKSKGELKHSYKELTVTGQSNSFEGLLTYIYRKNSLKLDLAGVSLVKLLDSLSYPSLITADVYGVINYSMKDKIVLFNTKLKKVKFIKTKMTNMIFNTTGVDMLRDTYNDSFFIGGYQNSILFSTIKIDNGTGKYIYLSDTRMNSKSNSITSKVEIKISGEKFFGDIYGTLKHPKVSIDVKKLMSYQLNKRLGSWLDKKDDLSKTLEKVDVERVKEKAKSFLNEFF